MRVGVVAALLLSVCAPVRAADELRLPLVTRATLENGLRLVVAEYHELPLVEVAAIVGAGAAQDPPGKEGLAELTAASLRRGTKRLGADALADTIEGLGGSLNAAAGTDGTTLTAEFLSGDFAAGLDLVRQVLLEPALASDEVRRARDEQVAGITASFEDPQTVAERCFAAFLWGTYPYGRQVDGQRATVKRLDRGDVRDFYDRWYRPNATVIVLVGDVVAAEAIAQLRAAFGSWKPRADALAVRVPPPARFTGRRVLLVDKADSTQTQIRFGNLAMKRADPALLPAQVANTILGGGFSSLLIEELRVKRSLTYSASSGFVPRLLGGDFRVATFTKSPTTQETLDLALQVQGGFRTRPIDPKQLAKAKAYLVGQFPLRVETPDALATRLAEIEFQGLPTDDLATYRSRVAAVSAAEAEQAAREWMPAPADVAIVVVGKAAEVRAPLEQRFGSVTVVVPEACENPATLVAAPAKGS